MAKLSVLIVVVTAYIFVIITIQVFTFLRAKVQHFREISAKKEKTFQDLVVSPETITFAADKAIVTFKL